jgi:hypothetical protein
MLSAMPVEVDTFSTLDVLQKGNRQGGIQNRIVEKLFKTMVPNLQLQVLTVQSFAPAGPPQRKHLLIACDTLQVIIAS